jgi:LPXTG-motif cell wall-anchored protein
MSAFGLYVIGFLVLAAGVLVGAYFLGVGSNWLIVIGLVLAGIAIVSGVVNTKRKENPDA